MIPIYHGKIDSGKLLLDTPSKYTSYLETLEGRRVEVVVRKERSQRSNHQNNYYWGVVLPVLGDYFGYESEEMHDALKMKFLRRGACDLETVKSTAKLNTAEFEEYLEKVRRWALSDYNIVVPLPNEAEP